MIKQKIDLEAYEWTIYVNVLCDNEDLDNIVKDLLSIDCNAEQTAEIHDYFADEERNKGVTYTNIPRKTSMVLVGKTTSSDEFINTLTHELFHVVVHICTTHGIDLEGEEPCYIMGKLCQATI